METSLIFDIFKTFLLPVLTAAVGWFASKLKTKREKQEADVNFINEAIKPLLNSIAELTGHIQKITDDFLSERDKNIELIAERTALKKEIEGLQNKIKSLERKIDALNKTISKQQNEKDTRPADAG